MKQYKPNYNGRIRGMKMTSDRIEEIIKQTAYPESMSVLSGMKQIWNEMQQEFNSRTCENCKAWTMEKHCEELDTVTDEDFGCNRFERKQNDQLRTSTR